MTKIKKIRLFYNKNIRVEVITGIVQNFISFRLTETNLA